MMQSASFWCCQFNIVSDDFDFQKPAFLPTREEQITCALGPEMAQATKPSRSQFRTFRMSWVDSKLGKGTGHFLGILMNNHEDTLIHSHFHRLSQETYHHVPDNKMHTSTWLLDMVGTQQQYKAWSKTKWKHFVWPAHCKHLCTASTLSWYGQKLSKTRVPMGPLN